jgi:hypothetical protein
MSVHCGLVILVDDRPKRTVRVLSAPNYRMYRLESRSVDGCHAAQWAGVVSTAARCCSVERAR